ncbi:cilia- and flagella-associated protein 74 [Crotalus adamanteus]|uniref:Cilia- and flagella-associated protein 74 n=1 Tax=Crotalus adamanteus TaxID=8729 RepID=A0AAW1ARN9_CROAD
MVQVWCWAQSSSKEGKTQVSDSISGREAGTSTEGARKQVQGRQFPPKSLRARGDVGSSRGQRGTKVGPAPHSGKKEEGGEVVCVRGWGGREKLEAPLPLQATWHGSNQRRARRQTKRSGVEKAEREKSPVLLRILSVTKAAQQLEEEEEEARLHVFPESLDLEREMEAREGERGEEKKKGGRWKGYKERRAGEVQKKGGRIWTPARQESDEAPLRVNRLAARSCRRFSCASPERQNANRLESKCLLRGGELPQFSTMESLTALEEDLFPDLYPIVEENKEEETDTLEELEQDVEGLEEDEVEAPPAEEESLEGAEEATEISKKSSEEFPVPSQGRTMNYTDRVRVLNLRRNLNQLDSLTKQKELLIQKTREELATCRARLDLLTSQQKDVEEDIENEKKEGNTTAVFRLQALHRRLCAELGNEKDLESKISTILNENVFEMWKIEIEEGNFAKLRKQLKIDEAELDQQRRDQAEERLQKQDEMAQLLSQRWQNTERKIQVASKAYEENLAKVLEESQRNHAKAVRFLKESLGKVREKELAEEQNRQEHLQKRMETVLSLKNSISSNRENLRTRQVLGKLIALDAEEQDQKIREAILAKGHNVTREFFCQKRQIEFEKRKKEFLEQQKARKIEIVARILKEEGQVEKMKAQSRLQESKDPDKLSDAVKWRMKTWRYIEETCSDKVAPVTQKPRRSPSISPSLDDRSFTASCEPIPESKTEGEEEDVDNVLAEPEFVGIWDQEYNSLQELDDKIDSKPLGVSKLEKDIFTRNLEKLHAGIIRKHRVCGREFKGCPFYSKPSLIHFKDFDVGKTYKKKVTLINAFYSINYCKLDGVSEHLKDFFHCAL